jgi:hypothetical protein
MERKLDDFPVSKDFKDTLIGSYKWRKERLKYWMTRVIVTIFVILCCYVLSFAIIILCVGDNLSLDENPWLIIKISVYISFPVVPIGLIIAEKTVGLPPFIYPRRHKENKKTERHRLNAEAPRDLKYLAKLRLEFWSILLERINKSRIVSFRNFRPSKINRITDNVGIHGIGLSFVISKSNCRTELIISRDNNEENKYIFNELFARKEKIEKDFGEELTWERLEDKMHCRISYIIENVNYINKEEWDMIMNILTDSMIRLEKTFLKPLIMINQTRKFI